MVVAAKLGIMASSLPKAAGEVGTLGCVNRINSKAMTYYCSLRERGGWLRYLERVLLAGSLHIFSRPSGVSGLQISLEERET